MKMLRILQVPVALCFLLACSHRDIFPTFSTSEGAAEKGLRDFQEHMSDTVANVLGFHDASEGKRSRLGDPIPVFEPDCKPVLSVRDTVQNLDPRAYSTREMKYYPILGDADRKVSLILVTRLDEKQRIGKAGEWITSRVGAKTLMGELDSTLKNNPMEKHPLQFLLQFNALGIAFLGNEEGKDGVRLVPVSLTDSAASCLGPLASGAGTRATNVFAALSRCYDKEQVCAELDVRKITAHEKEERKLLEKRKE